MDNGSNKVMEPAEAIDYARSLAREHKEADADFLLKRSEELSVEILNGKVEKVEQSTGLGLGLRVVREGRTGLAYTERLAPEAIEAAFQAARENATLPDATEVVMNRDPAAVPDPAALELYNPALEALTLDDLARFGLEAEAAAKAADPRVKTIPDMIVSRNSGSYMVASPHGLSYGQRSNSVSAHCTVLMEEGDTRKSGGKSWSRRSWDAAQGAVLGREAVEKCAELLGAKPIPGGKMPVVLDEWVAPRLLGMYMGNFSAESAQKGISRLKGRLGETIAGTDFSLVDDPHRVGASGSRYLDVEGVATRPMPLIENGVFTNFLYHIESARKAGVESTGHAGRGYTGGISTRTHNLVLEPGPHGLDALCAIPERCLLVTRLEGGAGCNPISGDISIGVQGFLVEGGERKQAVDSVTIAGNFYDLLNNIQALGNTYQPNLTSMFIPGMLLDGFTVSG